MHPVGFEPTPPKRLGLKSNALDQLGPGYKWAAWNSSDDGGVRTHARRLVPKTSASGRSQELRPLGHIINVRDSDRVRTRINFVRIDPATLTGVDFKSTALTTRPHYLAQVQSAERPMRESNPRPSDFPVRPVSRRRRSCVHPVGFEPTPPKRLGLKSNAFLARRDRLKTNSATDTERPPRDRRNNSDGTRTRNPQIRSLIRYPLRHGV